VVATEKRGKKVKHGNPELRRGGNWPSGEEIHKPRSSNSDVEEIELCAECVIFLVLIAVRERVGGGDKR